jgi:superfamily I DNA/RNA helicase
MAFTPSIQQQALFQWVETGAGSCVVEAVAGSGKTTSLIEALRRMRGRVFFGAYNKKIAVEIKDRVATLGRNDVFVSTMHAAGFGAWRRVAPKVAVDENKCRNLYRAYFGEEPAAKALEGAALSLVSYAKQAAFDVDRKSTVQDWLKLIDHFDVEVQDEAAAIETASKLLELSVAEDVNVIDFDDMIYAPLVHNTKLYQYDWVLIDEAQDTNASRRALALRMRGRYGRVIAVGDRHQAIYGFTGADHDALDLIAHAVKAKHLPLTVSYRCPRLVIAYAQQFVSHIQAHPTAPEGVVARLPAEAKLLEHAKPGDAILCRFTAPLLSYVYQFVGAGVPAKVEGREIGNGLKQIARRWKVKSFSTLLTRLEGYEEKECKKYRAKEQESRAQAVIDKVTCLRVLIGRVEQTQPGAANPVEALCNEIDTIFGQDVGAEAVLLSTIHKSKGREWNKVLWLQTGPSKWARQDWEKQQETNLCYVAATRAKRELVLVEQAPRERATPATNSAAA